MKNQLIKLIILMFALSASLISCKDDDKVNPPADTTPIDMLKLGETYVIGAKAKAVIYAKDSLKTGYNVIYVAMFDSADGSALTDGHFNLTPSMEMGAMMHSAPVENTGGANADGLFTTAVVFTMPGSVMHWFLDLSFHNHKVDLEGEGRLGVEVKESNPPRLINTIAAADGDAKLFISLISLKTPIVGINDFEITVHKMNSMMDFPAIEDYTIEIEPTMPSMGHGSPNNVNPVHQSNGHYLGKVNFTMSGLWQIKLKIYKNGTLLSDDQYFEIVI